MNIMNVVIKICISFVYIHNVTIIKFTYLLTYLLNILLLILLMITILLVNIDLVFIMIQSKQQTRYGVAAKKTARADEPLINVGST